MNGAVAGGAVTATPTGIVDADDAALAIRSDEDTTAIARTATPIGDLTRTTALRAVEDRVKGGVAAGSEAAAVVRLEWRTVDIDGMLPPDRPGRIAPIWLPQRYRLGGVGRVR